LEVRVIDDQGIKIQVAVRLRLDHPMGHRRLGDMLRRPSGRSGLVRQKDREGGGVGDPSRS
jgi:hypothetical protein